MVVDQIVIDGAEIGKIGVGGRGQREKVVSSCIGTNKIRRGIERKNLQGHGIDSVGGDNIVSKSRARSTDSCRRRVVDGGLSGEITTAFGEVGHRAEVLISAALVGEFVADKEEEKFVLDDGAADGADPLVVPQTRLYRACWAEIGPSVKYVILPILEGGAMKGVAAALADLV